MATPGWDERQYQQYQQQQYQQYQQYERQRDEDHLRLLAIGYWVYAALLGFVSLFPLIYVALGVLFLVLPAASSSGGAPPPPGVGIFMIVLGGAATLVIAAIACLYAVAARALQRRTSYTLLMVAAALACTKAPLGTVLGVFTFIVLMRPSVKALFEAPRGS